MKMVCTKKNLSQGLNTTSRLINTRNSLPVLNNILLKTEEGRLRLSSTNLEMAVNTWVGGKVEEEGEITVPAKVINDYINNLGADKITISSKNQTLFIETELAKTHIKGLPAEEFPLIPKINNNSLTKLDSKNLQAAIKEVTFAANYSETQPEIAGILMVFQGKTLTLAATDRYRLAERQLEILDEVPAAQQIILPSRAVNEVGRILNSGVVEIYLSEGQICFRTGDAEVISRLIQGQYPDYRQIIPKKFITEGVVEREQFIQALRAASLFATDTSNIVLEFDPGQKQIVVKSASAQVGDSEIGLAAELVGEKNSIIFNYHYLLECLGNISDKKVAVKLINSSSPATVVPEGRENYLYLVMPIKT